MNIIFWALVVMSLAVCWLCFAMAFRAIGKPFKRMVSVARNEINKDDEKDMEETNHE